MGEFTISYLLLFFGLILVARPASAFLDRFLIKLRAHIHKGCPSDGLIRLANEEGDPKKRPFPRFGLIPVAVLALGGIIVQIIGMFNKISLGCLKYCVASHESNANAQIVGHTVFALAPNNWRSALLTWWNTQIVYFVLLVSSLVVTAGKKGPTSCLARTALTCCAASAAHSPHPRGRLPVSHSHHNDILHSTVSSLVLAQARPRSHQPWRGSPATLAHPRLSSANRIARAL